MRRALILALLMGLCAAGGWAEDVTHEPLVQLSISETDAGNPGETDEILIFHDGLIVSETLYTQPVPTAQIVRGTATSHQINDLATELATDNVRTAEDCNAALPPSKPGFPPNTAVITSRLTWFGREAPGSGGRGTGQQHTFTVTTSANPPAPLCSPRELVLVATANTLYGNVLFQEGTIVRQYPPPAP